MPYHPRIRKFLKNNFHISFEQLHNAYLFFAVQLRSALSLYDSKISDLQCYVTCVHDMPSGHERGKFLNIELTPTELRCSFVILMGNHKHEQATEVYKLPDDLPKSNKNKFFNFIATCLETFILEVVTTSNQSLPISFTFPFPCLQPSLESAYLVKWTGNFNIKFDAFADICKMLQNAVAALETIQISNICLLHNTTHLLMSGAYENPECRIGLIIGRNCNVCYYESVKCINRIDNEYQNERNMVVNLEWGSFGEKGYLDHIKNAYDEEIDNGCRHVGKDTFNKFVSGKYMVQLLRLILIKLIFKGGIFKCNRDRVRILDTLLNVPETITVHLMGQISRACCSISSDFMQELHAREISYEDLCVLKDICDAIIKRSATMVAIPLSALINKISEPRVAIAVDGIVFRELNNYEKYMRQVMNRFVYKKIFYDFVLPNEKSAVGGALIAELNRTHGIFHSYIMKIVTVSESDEPGTGTDDSTTDTDDSMTDTDDGVDIVEEPMEYEDDYEGDYEYEYESEDEA